MKTRIPAGVFILLIFSLISGACIAEAPSAAETAVMPQDTAIPQPQPTEPAVEKTPETSERILFKQLGISLKVPDGLTVIKEPIPNPDDPSRLQAYTFFIQNYSTAEGPGEEYFQMYGLLQYDLPSAAWEEVAGNILDSEMYVYTQEIVVNGLPGIESQLGGQRNRYVYHFPLDGYVLNIAVAEATEANKILADQIINTLQFTPGSVTDASELD